MVAVQGEDEPVEINCQTSKEKNDKPVRLEGGDHLVLVVHYLEDQNARYGRARVEQGRDVGGPVKVG